jgi:hypothetical protein
MLLEPDVALTDYGLTIECAVLAWLAWRSRGQATQRHWFVALFIALSIAALMGGTAHGFIGDKGSATHNLVWSGSLIAIGIAAFACWNIGALLLFDARAAHWITLTTATIFAIYVGAVIGGARSFFIVVVHYLPAVLFLLLAMLIAWRRARDTALLVGVGGVTLTLAAAGIQHAGVGLGYLNHNALYHLVQGVALLLIFIAARSIVARIAGGGEADADKT